MKIFVSAAEISSDIHAEKILKSIQETLAAQNVLVEWMGIGGPRVRALPGFRPLENAESLRTMGFVEVVKKYGFFKKVLARAAESVSAFNPDLILTFDYPDFHFRLMKRIKDGGFAPNALKICGIPPKVWVWRSKRVEQIRRYFHGVWVIFPFEQNYYKTAGIPVIYEGNPLLDDLRTRTDKKPWETITVMPGSRDAELKHHLPIIPEAMELFAKKTGKKITAQVPVPRGVSIDLFRSVLRSSPNVEYRFMEDGSETSLAETRLGLIKSGTSTLEAAVLNCIPVIFYRMSLLSESIFRWFVQWWGGYRGPVGLPNILLGVKKRTDSWFREFLGPDATPEKLSNELFHLYSSPQAQADLTGKCAEIRAQFNLDAGGDSARRSAVRILGWMKNPPVARMVLPSTSCSMNSVISYLWSSVNWARRRWVRLGFMKVYQVHTPSVLVGNLQAGGAGKTPLVIALASEAVARGKKVAVVSRGFGKSEKLPFGDESQEILYAVPEVILGVGANRRKAIQQVEKKNPELIIFDDGYQNLKFKAHLNLIALTGRTRREVVYRDFSSEIKFADLVVGTKGILSKPPFVSGDQTFFKIEWEWVNPIAQPVWVLCSIADPRELIQFYQEQGLVIRKIIPKGDHASLDEGEVNKLMTQAHEEGCLLAITEKDRVKIPSLHGQVYVLKRRIKNRDWLEFVFDRLQGFGSADKMGKDESR